MSVKARIGRSLVEAWTASWPTVAIANESRRVRTMAMHRGCDSVERVCAIGRTAQGSDDAKRRASRGRHGALGLLGRSGGTERAWKGEWRGERRRVRG